MRHYYASLLIAKDHGVKAAPARLGHKTAQETLGTSILDETSNEG